MASSVRVVVVGVLVCWLVLVVSVCFAQGEGITSTMQDVGTTLQNDLLAGITAVAPYILKVAIIMASIFLAVGLIKGVAFRV